MYYAYVVFNTGKNNVYLGGLFKTKPTNQQQTINQLRQYHGVYTDEVSDNQIQKYQVLDLKNSKLQNLHVAYTSVFQSIPVLTIIKQATKPTQQQAAKALKLENIRKDGITIDSFGEPGGNMCIIV